MVDVKLLQADPEGRPVVARSSPSLMLGEEHPLCPGCGEPVALRLLLEVIDELDLTKGSIGVVGHGCYTLLSPLVDIDMLQCAHGRAPAAATGVKRMLPSSTVFTLQGDGDMVNEGLHEVIHAAARSENITCILLNNGVFGDTGGQMTAATPLGQRTKTSLDGRDLQHHGNPINLGQILSVMDGPAYVARGTVNSAGAIAQTKRMLTRAFKTQAAGEGFSLVEILTMCPTGWFVGVKEGPRYLQETLGTTFELGELRVREAEIA